MSTLGKAVITFAADTATFIGDVGKAAAAFERSLSKMSSVALGFKSAIAGSLSLGALTAFSKNVLDSADSLVKLEDKTSIAVDRLSELKVAFVDLGGASDEAFQKGLVNFNKSLVEASDGSSKASKLFKAMGVDIKAGPYEALRQFADSFAQLPDDELRAAAAAQVFKKSGEAFIPALAQGSKGLDAAAEKARSLGLVVSEDFGRSAERFNDNMKLISKSTVGFANAILQGGVLDVLGDMADKLEKAAEKGEKLKALGNIASIVTVNNALSQLDQHPEQDPNGEVRRRLQQRADLLANPNSQFFPGAQSTGQFAVGKIRGATPAAAANSPVPDPKAVRDALAQSEAEVKRYTSALNVLEKQLGALRGETSEETTLFEVFGRNITMSDGTVVHLDGSLEKLTAAHKVNLLNLALEITQRKNLSEVIEGNLVAHKADVEALERAQEIFKSYVLETNDGNRELQFQIDLTGKSALEQEKMNALHQIDVDLIRQRRVLAAQLGDDQEKFDEANAQLEEAAQRRRDAAIKSITERQNKERDFYVGSKQFLKDYVDSTNNAADDARTLWSDSFKGMEDALVAFTQTGKLNFRSLVDSVLADLARIEIRKNITGPLASGLAGLLSSSPGAYTGDAAPFALGGIMTAQGPMPLYRYAGGGVADKPQLAMFGEGSMNEAFVPLPDGKRIPVNLNVSKGGDGGGTYYIDARGADRDGMARLEAQIRALNGSVERRAGAAVAEMRRRGGNMSKAMAGGRK